MGRTKKPSKKEIETENYELQETIKRLGNQIEKLESEKRREKEGSVMPERTVKKEIGEILGELNKTILNLPENINKAIKEDEIETKPKYQQNLNLSFEEYQTYLGLVDMLNQYIFENINQTESEIYELEYINSIIMNIKKFQPDFKEKNLKVYKFLEDYNSAIENFIETNDISYLENLNNIYELDKFDVVFKALPNIEPTRKKQELLKNKVLPGTNNVLFTKLKSDKKTSYDEILGDYIRLDIDKAIPCKLRYNEKEGQNPFYVIQGDKKFVFNNIGLAKSFCLNGGYQADFINAKRNIDFDKKYKNTYVPAYVVR